MKTKNLLLLLLLSAFTVSFAAKKSVSYNVMMNNKKDAKVVKKQLKSIDGVTSVKTNVQTGQVDVYYNDDETTIPKISAGFKTAGYYASPIGENCANKPGGCLNNKPTTTNTMR